MTALRLRPGAATREKSTGDKCESHRHAHPNSVPGPTTTVKATAEKGPCPPPASDGLDPDRPQAPPPASRNPDSSRPMLLSTSAVLKAYRTRESARGRVETQVLIQQPGSEALTSNRFLDDGAAGLWAIPRVARGQSTCGESPLPLPRLAQAAGSPQDTPVTGNRWTLGSVWGALLSGVAFPQAGGLTGGTSTRAPAAAWWGPSQPQLT